MKLAENARSRKNSVWLWIRILVFFALFILVGLLPALSVIPVSAVRPLADMQRSEGTISFRSVGGRSGALSVLKKSNGDKEEFSCRENMTGLHDCIHRRYAGGFAQIHWFWVKTPLGRSYKFPAQIIVNREVVRDRATAIKDIENTRVIFQFGLAPLAFIGFVACVFVMVVDKGTTTDESVNNGRDLER
jgi:hypothetical protein